MDVNQNKTFSSSNLRDILIFVSDHRCLLNSQHLPRYLGDPHIATLLTTLDNLIWTGTLYMGPSFKTVEVVFDTSSDWLAVEDSSCGSCLGNTFDASRTGKLVNTSKVIREYGSLAFSAYEYEDKVCLVTSSCVNKFQYLAI